MKPSTFGLSLVLASVVVASGCTPSSSQPDAAAPPPEGGVDGGAEASAPGDATSPPGDAGSITSCTTATVYSGNPSYFGDLIGQNPNGHPIKADPPLRFRDIAFNGDALGVSTAAELWSMDTTSATPAYMRIAGIEGTNGYKPGACATALFGNARGLAPAPGGDWFVADFVGNAVLRVSGVGKPDCQVSVLAGNSETFGGVETAPFKSGDLDGAGSAAKLNGPRDIVSDSAGNVYFVDEGNRKVKKVASDAAHTVTTLVNLDEKGFADAALNAATYLDGAVYLGGQRATNANLVLRVSAADGALTTLLDDRETLVEAAGSGSAAINAMANDGTALVVSGASGYVWRMTTDGKTGPAIAGGGKVAGLNPTKYDFTMPFPATQAPMSSPSTVNDTVAVKNGSIFLPSVANGVGYWLYEFHCK